MSTVRNTFGYVVGQINKDDQFYMSVTVRNYFLGFVDGWMLDETVIEKLKLHGVTQIKLHDKGEGITYFVSLEHFLDRCDTMKSKHELLYILPTGRFDACEPKQKNWPIPYAE